MTNGAYRFHQSFLHQQECFSNCSALFPKGLSNNLYMILDQGEMGERERLFFPGGLLVAMGWLGKAGFEGRQACGLNLDAGYFGR